MAEPPAGFAAVLRSLRTRAGLTQEELAGTAGLSPRAISDLERGVVRVPHKDTVRLLADALRLTGPARDEFAAIARDRAGQDTAGETAAGVRTLPRDVASFTGRGQELAALVDAAATTSSVVSIHAIGGMAGVGKTAFAIHAAHRLAELFPVTQLKLDLNRNKRLMVGNATAQRDMELARYSYESNAAKVKRLESSLRMIRDARRDARLQAAEFDMKQANAVLKKAKWRKKNTAIKAPISGTILTKKAELGNIVNPSAFSSGISASLCEMANLRKLEIDLSIQERRHRRGQDRHAVPGHAGSVPERQGVPATASERLPRQGVAVDADRRSGQGRRPVASASQEIPESEEGRFLRPDMGSCRSCACPTREEPDRGESRDKGPADRKKK